MPTPVNSAGHTPGPWFVSSSGRNRVASITSTTGIYADVEPDGRAIVADARLIALAPELLEALRDFCDHGFDAERAAALLMHATGETQ